MTKRFRKENGLIFDEQEECISASVENVIDLLNSLNEQAEYWEDKYKRREFNIENELERTQKLIFSLMDNITEKERENEQLRNFIELMNMRQKWKLYKYMGDNDE